MSKWEELAVGETALMDPKVKNEVNRLKSAEVGVSEHAVAQEVVHVLIHNLY